MQHYICPLPIWTKPEQTSLLAPKQPAVCFHKTSDYSSKEDSLPIDPEPLWGTRQWHRRLPSQRCIKFFISWKAGHMLHRLQERVRLWYYKKRNTNPGKQFWRTNYHLLYLDMTTHSRHLNRTGIKGSPMWPLCGDADQNIPWPHPEMSEFDR